MQSIYLVLEMSKSKALSRRTFLELLGKGTVSASLLPYITSCNSRQRQITTQLKGILPTDKDDLVLASGLKSEMLIAWGDKISGKDTFGFNNDYLCYIPLKDKMDEGILWCNHEYVDETFIHGEDLDEKTQEQIDKELYEVGGSLLHIQKEKGSWRLVENSWYNRRVTGLTNIPFNWDEKIENSSHAMGTLGNCAGGITPWGTFLTCEENYQHCYGDRSSDSRDISASDRGCEKIYANPPEHYGWVVEVNPHTGLAQKHVALGRCAHECATVRELDDGRVVVYTGDDKINECLYKFVSSKPHSLKEGTLYVADTKKGKWIPVDVEKSSRLKKKFFSQTQALVYLRESARILGGTRLNRPEDIEIDPVDGSVLVALTNNVSKMDFHGSLLKIEEKDGKHDALEFKATTYLSGGEENGFSSPDNLVFDRKGNLWFTSDIAGSSMNKFPYSSFKNNGLFVVMREGPDAGKVIQLASAPTDAEFTGPWFSPDSKTLFLSVQHPGERSSSLTKLTSHWPDGGESIPKPAVVCISGETLEKIQGLV